MSRSRILIGTMAAFGLAAVIAGAGDTSLAVACDATAKSAGASASCCSKDKDASAASIQGNKLNNRTRYVTASTAGACTHSTAAAAAAGCEGAKTATAASSACEAAHSAAVTTAAGAASCCEAKSAKTAAMGAGCTETTAVKVSVDELPYGENKRVVLTGTYECGHCALHMTEDCAPMLKTADGKIYPLMDNARSEAMRAANAKNGVEVTGLVRKIDGVRYLDVKSYRAL